MSERQRTQERHPRSWLPAWLLATIVAGMVSPATAAELPYRASGLSESEAAAHLLDRLAYGARPGEVETVLEMGLEHWVDAQLDAAFEEKELERRLRGLDALAMDPETLVSTFPDPGRVLRRMQRSGDLPEGLMETLAGADGPRGMSAQQRQSLRALFEKEGWRPQRDLLGQLMAQKVLRAVYAENQLREVLTDFWFNHFNVTVRHNQARVHILSYERDAIRPRSLGDFRQLLEATARHPAMLLYLDNASSRAEDGQTTALERRMPTRRRGRAGARRSPTQGADLGRPTGLNENYARELLELHTLGVDGGYTQDDVIEVARAFTGWVYLPPEAMAGAAGMRTRNARQVRRLPPPEIAARVGFVRDGLFVFHPGFHDAETKTVLGHRLAPGRGLEDGLEVLDILAEHPATARHLAYKLAVRFVADRPPRDLVDRLAAVFGARRGDLRAVMRALIESPEFWKARRAKVKSPFELVVSSLRGLGADVDHPGEAVEWTARIGQRLYSYQAPTGYPDEAEFWVNTGALLNRMSFGLRLASDRLRGVRVDLLELNDGREPESLERAVDEYAALLMPERDSDETRRLLGPLLNDPDYLEKVDQAAPRDAEAGPQDLGRWDERRDRRDVPPADAPGALAQVVGLLLGSPEFQRR